MNPKKYVKILKSIEANSAAYTCPYCGALTYSVSDSFFCSNCEAFIPSAKALNQEDTKAASEIRKLVQSNDFAQAEQAYEALPEYATNPYFAYAEALACISESNYETAQINYALKGFMEENTTHRNNSLAAFSKARLLFSKAVYTAKKGISGGPETAKYIHAMFMAYMKLGDLKAAHSTLEKTGKLGNILLSEYENMVLKNGLRDYAGAANHAERLLSGDLFTLNAAYYLAYAAFKTGKPKEALYVLGSFPDKSENETVLALMKEIKSYMEI